MKVLVTGSTGFLGRYVAEEVMSSGHDVIGFDLRTSGLCATVIGDLTDFGAVDDAIANVDCVCHLGAVGDVYRALERPHEAAAINVLGTANVAEAVRRNGRCRIIYASTWEVYGVPRYEPMDENHPCAPDHPYNITKLAGEQLVLSYDRLKNVPAVALRLGTAFGVGMRRSSVLSLFIDRARRGLPITIFGTGDQIRQFTHAKDIARAFRLAVESDARGIAINVASDQTTSIRQLAELVSRLHPTRVECGAARAGDISPGRVCSERAGKLLGWKAQIGLADGLEEMIHAHEHEPEGR